MPGTSPCRCRACPGPLAYTLLLTAGVLIWFSAFLCAGALLLP